MFNQIWLSTTNLTRYLFNEVLKNHHTFLSLYGISVSCMVNPLFEIYFIHIRFDLSNFLL